MHVPHPEFAFLEQAIGIHQTGLAQANRFYFSSGKHNTRGVSFEQFVIERGPFVFYIYGCLFHFFETIGDQMSDFRLFC